MLGGDNCLLRYLGDCHCCIATGMPLRESRHFLYSDTYRFASAVCGVGASVSVSVFSVSVLALALPFPLLVLGTISPSGGEWRA